jgi:resolvase-like protein
MRNTASDTLRAVLYCRTASDHVAAQRLKQLRRYCAQRDWQIVAEYHDAAHGARHQLADVFDAVERREVDAVVFWSINDLGRRDWRAVLATLEWLAGRAEWYSVDDHFSHRSGFSAVQIGAQLGCSRMTVARRLQSEM